ncbi:MAG: hypothetical protein Q6352_019715 [Candidatus Freyrarchaeum guaymaensis]
MPDRNRRSTIHPPQGHGSRGGRRPDESGGKTPKAFIVLKEGETATEQEIIDYCKERLAGYKKPTKVEFVNSLPKSAVGKILRKVLRDHERKKYEAQKA